tara:strand:- start:1758 stop:2522 length:765 start_codon:yes stop_codon:yes gene_type:complete
MKKSLIVLNIIYLISSINLLAQVDAEKLFNTGNELYNEGRNIEAINYYKQIINNDIHSAELYYNMANAYYKIDSIASSIYYYEKALALNPSDKEIINNLKLVNNALVDEINPIAEPIFQSILNQFSNIFYFESWGYISIFFSFLIVVLFLTYYFAKETRIKRVTFISLCTAVILMLISLVNGYRGFDNIVNDKYAIIYAYETDLKTEPNNRSETLFMLHEGTKVKVLENYNNWIKIQLTNGQIGFLQLIDVKIL